MGLFNDRIQSENGKTQVPVWFMRQAGRYHSHYQNIKKNSDFISMCKTPELALEITMGPIEDFNFDAAILFSDLLFPLEQMGMGLTYAPGPKLGFTLENPSDLKKLNLVDTPENFYKFQADSCSLLRAKLPKEKTLLGFVGAPFTLYTYAVEGGHSGNLTASKKGLVNGLWQGFTELLLPNLLTEMKLQAEAGADAICLFDTAVGELSFSDYKKYIPTLLRTITAEFKSSYPDKKIIYYSKLTQPYYLEEIQDPNIDVIGIDWRNDLAEHLNRFGKDYMIQGNIDPSWLHLPWDELEKNLNGFWETLQNKKVDPSRWIAGLGHGVLQQTPEENVRNTVGWIHSNIQY